MITFLILSFNNPNSVWMFWIGVLGILLMVCSIVLAPKFYKSATGEKSSEKLSLKNFRIFVIIKSATLIIIFAILIICAFHYNS